jgi:hypothetical protein
MVNLLVRSMGASGIRDAIMARVALPLLMEMPAKLDFSEEAVEGGLESDTERPEVVMASVRFLGGGGGRDRVT